MHIEAPCCTCLTCETRRTLERPFPYLFHLDISATRRLATFVNLAEDFSEIHLVHLDRLFPPGATSSVPVTTPGTILLYRCRDDLLYPRLAPDGRWVCFSQLRSQQGLYVAEACHPGRVHRLTDGFDLYPTWVEDGSVITFNRLDRLGQTHVLRVSTPMAPVGHDHELPQP